MKRIIIEHQQIDGIPLMTVRPDGPGRWPVVVYLHGFGGDKRSGLEYGYKLAEKGICLVGFDCRLHGERAGEPSFTAGFERVFPEDAGLDTYILMHEIIASTVEDFNRLIAHLRADEHMNTGRLGVTGFSMGAFAAYLIAASCPQVQVAVPIGGKPAFRRGWEDIVLATGAYAQWRQAMEEAAEASEKRSVFLGRIDPFDKMDGFAPRPLLMINGERDTDQPYHYALALYRKLLPLYQGCEDRLQLSLPPVGHELTHDLLDEACRWFKQYL